MKEKRELILENADRLLGVLIAAIEKNSDIKNTNNYSNNISIINKQLYDMKSVIEKYIKELIKENGYLQEIYLVKLRKLLKNLKNSTIGKEYGNSVSSYLECIEEEILKIKV